MTEIRFEWDDAEAESNLSKHGVSFDEASTIFFDEHGLFMPDPQHSDQEDRFVLLGLSHTLRLLIVSHCYRQRDDIIRLISARKADRSERRQYSERLTR